MISILSVQGFFDILTREQRKAEIEALMLAYRQTPQGNRRKVARIKIAA